jgi:hypothetical protein
VNALRTSRLLGVVAMPLQDLIVTANAPRANVGASPLERRAQIAILFDLTVYFGGSGSQHGLDDESDDLFGWQIHLTSRGLKPVRYVVREGNLHRVTLDDTSFRCWCSLQKFANVSGMAQTTNHIRSTGRAFPVRRLPPRPFFDS